MKQTVAERKQAAQRWLAEWPVGKEGVFVIGPYRRSPVTVVAHETGEKGWPVLRLEEKMTGATYYCFYGWRRDLRPVLKEVR